MRKNTSNRRGRASADSHEYGYGANGDTRYSGASASSGASFGVSALPHDGRKHHGSRNVSSTSSGTGFPGAAGAGFRSSSASAKGGSFNGNSDQGIPANPYSRRVTQGDYARQRKRKKRKTVVAVVLCALLVLVLGGAGAAFAYYQTINNNLHQGISEDLNNALVDTAYAGDPFYMLLMGTDGSEERASSSEYAGDTFRSDSMMLVRIDPENKKATMVSLHRDTMINMGQYGAQKLNAAHSLGGSAYTVQVVSEMAGVPISHYAEIDFDGFRDIVDALGGVEVDVPMEINDSMAGGHVDAGLQTLTGDQALILCRARHAYDDYGDGDRYRAANQRLVLAAIAKKILASDPVTMVNTVEALSRYITTDFDVSEIVSLAQSMRGMDTSTDIYTAMEPTTSEYTNNTWYEHLDKAAWQKMMTRIDQGLSPTEEDEIDEATGTVLASAGNGGTSSGSSSSASSSSSSGAESAASVTPARSGTVTVKNGTSTSGLAAKAAEKIAALGYSTETGNANNSNYRTTVVVYNNSSQAEAAKEIASTIGVSTTTLNDGVYSFSSDFLVVIGSDWS